MGLGYSGWCWTFLVCLYFQSPSSGQDVNPSCTTADSNCQVPGQSCVFSFIQNRRICACSGDEFAAGPNCQSRCPAVDSSVFGSCTGTSALCTLPCNYPNGECNYANGQCVCSEGFLGVNCSAQCPGYPEVCSGHGACLLGSDYSAICVCDVGFRGENCAVECPGGPGNTCSGHGECDRNGECVCHKEWRGPDCALHCAGSSVAACSGHGACQDDASCLCEWGYAGVGCEFACPLFTGQPCGCAAADDDGCRGTCTDEGVCSCRPGFAGADCGMECPRSNGVPCSGHGVCATSGLCVCSGTWTGPGCGVECPGSGGVSCSGHGRCELTSWTSTACVCERGLVGEVEGYAGDACERAILNVSSLIAPEEQEWKGSIWPAVVIQLPFWFAAGFLGFRWWKVNNKMEEGGTTVLDESDSKTASRATNSPRHSHQAQSPLGSPRHSQRGDRTLDDRSPKRKKKQKLKHRSPHSDHADLSDQSHSSRSHTDESGAQAESLGVLIHHEKRHLADLERIPDAASQHRKLSVPSATLHGLDGASPHGTKAKKHVDRTPRLSLPDLQDLASAAKHQHKRMLPDAPQAPAEEPAEQ